MNRVTRSALLLVLLPALAAAQDAVAVPYADAKPILDELREDLWPAEFRGKTAAQVEASWPAWVSSHDAAIRARVADGDEDTLVHFLLFGTSFTKTPRATARDLASLATTPDAALKTLRPRIDDFIAALATPGGNERLQIAREVLARHGIDLATPMGKADARQHIDERARKVGLAGAEQLQAMVTEPGQTSTIFRERGLSTDTTTSIDFGVERALSDLDDKGLLPPDSVRRVAIVGPGLDFVDKQHGYDFYPPQTIQPFAVIDSLQRLGLASSDGVQVTAFDVSPRVVRHIAGARERARAGMPYTVVLARDLDQAWTPELDDYWSRIGNFIGEETKAVAPPLNAGRVRVRGVTVRAPIVLQVMPRDLNVVLQRLPSAAAEGRFDLVIATNILLYYDVFEQSLALANISAMLRPGGILLSNSRVVELPSTPMELVGRTDVTYSRLAGIGDAGDRVLWYQRQ
jgi:SAM-dependent methyltransferase